MSLQVKIDAKEVRLPEDFELAINLENNLLNGDREDATYPMEVSLAANRHVFGFADRVNSDVSGKSSAGVDFGPYRLLGGSCVLTDTGEGSVEFYISTEKSSFWGRAKHLMLDESCPGRFVNSSEMGAQALTTFYRSLKEELDFVVCPARDSWMTNVLGTAINFYNYLEPGSEAFAMNYQGKPVYYTPFLRLTVVVKKVLEQMGYEIGENELAGDSDLKDLLIVCRRNPIDVGQGAAMMDRYAYGKHLPRMSVYKFLREVENKFGYNFIVDDSSLRVDIKRFALVSEKVARVKDGVEKQFLSEGDRVTGITYRDADSGDELVQPLKDFLRVTFGAEADAETVECVSTIVGVATDVKTFVRPNVKPDYKYEYRFAAFQEEYSEEQDYRERVDTELRFSIYRGMQKSSPVEDSGRTYEFYYPVASPIPEDDTQTFLLMWDGPGDCLKNHVEERAMVLVGAKQSHEFQVVPELKNLDNLQDFFTNVLVIRNRRYLCHEQEVVVNGDTFVSHTVRCYPL